MNIIVSILFILIIPSGFCLDNGLGLVPPMGWLSWLRYGCTVDCVKYPNDCISENLIMSIADAMAVGYRDAGYEYVMIDDCWLSSKRAPNDSLLPDPVRFPKGIKFLTDYVHSKGLKFGIYEDYGLKTCAGYPGSMGHLEMDAITFASWGVDYVKFDGCWNIPILQPEGIADFSGYLNATGRPIFLNVEWPLYIGVKHLWPSQISLLKQTTNMARVYTDIEKSWSSLLGVLDFYKTNENDFASWAGPGHFNDPDMLVIGNDCVTPQQEQLQMTMWAIFAAPLIMSNNLRTISNSSKSILTNKNVISINQDSLGIQGRYIKTINITQFWIKPLVNQKIAIALANVNSENTVANFTLKDLGLSGKNQFVLTEVYDMKQQINVTIDTRIYLPIQSTSALLFLCVTT